jgi:hypothetical protein
MDARFLLRGNRTIRGTGSIAGTAIFVAALVTLLGATVRFLLGFAGDEQPTWQLGTTTLATAGMLYLASHALRIARLAVLAGDPGVSVARFGLVHMMAAGVSFITPYKLGEIFRVIALGHLLGSAGRSLVVVWVERAFDSAAIILLILAASLIDSHVVEQIRPLIVMSVIFVVATIALFTIVPERLSAMSFVILRRRDGEWTVRILRAIRWVQHRIALAGKLLDGKIATLSALTAAIWSLELATLGAIMPATADRLREIATGLPVFLSGQTSGGVPAAPTSSYGLHGLVITATLLLLGSAAALIYAPIRLRRRARGRGPARIAVPQSAAWPR